MTAPAVIQTPWKNIVRFGRVVLLVIIFALAQSILWSPDTNMILTVFAVGLALASFWKPEYGLLIVAAVVPLGLIINRTLDADPVRTSESFVLAFLAGVMLRRIVTKTTSSNDSPPHPWLYLLLLVVVGSCVAQLVTQQLWQDYPATFIDQVFGYLVTGYHDQVGDLRIWVRPASFEYIATTILFVTGILLALVTENTIERNQQTARRVAAALVLGACVASVSSAILGIQTPEIIPGGFTTDRADSQEYGVVRTFVSMIASDTRWAGFTGKVSSAGSFFVLIIGIAVGGIRRQSRFSPLWLTGAIATTVMLLLSGSRAALGAAVVTLIALYGFQLMHLATSQRKQLLWSALGVTVIVAVAVISRWEAVMNYLPTVLQHRWQLTLTAMRMAASEPIFGVGISQFYPLSEQFSSPEFLTLNDSTYLGARTNTHNYFLQVAAELGILGFIAFVLSLYTPLRSSWKHIKFPRNNWLLTGTFAGVVCFLLTCLAGQPLIIAIVGYPFWIALGLLGALNNMAHQTKHSTEAQALFSRHAPGHARTPRIIVITGTLIVATLTFAKATRDRNDVDLTRIDYGFYDWETVGGIAPVPLRAGTEYRWSRENATIFLPGNTEEITVPLRAAAGVSGQAITVTIKTNDHTANTTVLEDDLWHQVVIPLTTNGHQDFHRVDFNVFPTWIPSAVDPNSNDHRQLGVMVGEITAKDRTGKKVLISDPFP
tara:strand:- start:4163 stop:6304 length:2142 start_codon:yes stop_codon:yes gene_type:complete